MVKKLLNLLLISSLMVHAQAGWTDTLNAQIAKIKNVLVKNDIIAKKDTEYHKTKAVSYGLFSLAGLALSGMTFQAFDADAAIYNELNFSFISDQELRTKRKELARSFVTKLPFFAVGIHSAYTSLKQTYKHIQAARKAN